MPIFNSRAEVPQQYRWNDTSLYESPEAWQADIDGAKSELETFMQWKGRLHESAQLLADVFDGYERLMKHMGKLYIYAMLGASVDTTDMDAAKRQAQVQSLVGMISGALSFVDPELVSIGHDTLKQWMESEPRLRISEHYFDNLFRQQAHLRSAEVEEILGMVTSAFYGTTMTRTALSDSDLPFTPAKGSDGSEHRVTQGSISDLLSNTDREVRRTAWESFQDAHLAFKNTFANNLSTSVQQNVFTTRVRNYESTLGAALFTDNVPTTVYENLIDTFKKNLPLWHRYWAVRRRMLNVPTLAPYDVWAPLTAQRPHIPYEQAVEWICAGLAPLGTEYVETVRRGCLQDRWIDVFPSPGKSSAEFSAGWPGTMPFIVMNYDDTLFSLSTLAHELGHSMHSYMSWKTQPFMYANYSIFVAEVASNFNQALVRDHLLRTQTDRDFQISVIEEAMSNFHRYFFIMPTLARFELEIHQRMERGRGATAKDMNNLMADLFSEAFGSEVELDRDRVGITWATFGHLYQDYYVYQYATGISGAHALARRVLAGAPGATDAYLGFLSTGSSRYPLDALKVGGVDLSTPQPVEDAFAVLAGYVERLEKLAEG